MKNLWTDARAAMTEETAGRILLSALCLPRSVDDVINRMRVHAVATTELCGTFGWSIHDVVAVRRMPHFESWYMAMIEAVLRACF